MGNRQVKEHRMAKIKWTREDVINRFTEAMKPAAQTGAATLSATSGREALNKLLQARGVAGQPPVAEQPPVTGR